MNLLLKHHQLKTWPEQFQAVAEKRKLWEFRINDRDFQEGDSVELREFDPFRSEYSGRWIFCKVGYVLRGPNTFGLPEGYCIWTVILPTNHTVPKLPGELEAK